MIDNGSVLVVLIEVEVMMLSMSSSVRMRIHDLYTHFQTSLTAFERAFFQPFNLSSCKSSEALQSFRIHRDIDCLCGVQMRSAWICE